MRARQTSLIAVPTIRGGWDRLESVAVAAWVRAQGVRVGVGCRFYGRPIVSGARLGTIDLGAGATFVSRSRHTALGISHPVVLRVLLPEAVVIVGPGTGMSGGAICAARSVIIGRNCLVGADVTIADTNFHDVDSLDRRHAPIPAPTAEDVVRIGDEVFIGKGAIILPGTTVGDHAVVGAGSVLKGEVAPHQIVAGNPARPLRFLRTPHAGRA